MTEPNCPGGALAAVSLPSLVTSPCSAGGVAGGGAVEPGGAGAAGGSGGGASFHVASFVSFTTWPWASRRRTLSCLLSPGFRSTSAGKTAAFTALPSPGFSCGCGGIGSALAVPPFLPTQKNSLLVRKKTLPLAAVGLPFNSTSTVEFSGDGKNWSWTTVALVPSSLAMKKSVCTGLTTILPSAQTGEPMLLRP